MPHHGILHPMKNNTQEKKRKKKESSVCTKLPTGSLERQHCVPKNTGSLLHSQFPTFLVIMNTSLGGKGTSKVSGFLLCSLSHTASLDVCIKAGTGTATHFLQAKRRAPDFSSLLWMAWHWSLDHTFSLQQRNHGVTKTPLFQLRVSSVSLGLCPPGDHWNSQFTGVFSTHGIGGCSSQLQTLQ